MRWRDYAGSVEKNAPARLAASSIEERALQQISEFHRATVDEVAASVRDNKLVVVGMRQNPVVKKARSALGQAGLAYEYLEYGSYLSEWKRRLAIKLWSGWPTFPQVFVRGRLIGGAAELDAAIASGELQKWLAEGT